MHHHLHLNHHIYTVNWSQMLLLIHITKHTESVSESDYWGDSCCWAGLTEPTSRGDGCTLRHVAPYRQLPAMKCEHTRPVTPHQHLYIQGTETERHEDPNLFWFITSSKINWVFTVRFKNKRHMWRHEYHPPHLINAVTLPCIKMKHRKCMWTQVHLAMLTTK